MAKKRVNISLPSVDELFTSQVERDSKGSSVIQLLPVASIVPFPNHPFGVRDDQDMEQLIESIQEHGILSPLTVRVASDGTFELISGHKRKHAAEKSPTARATRGCWTSRRSASRSSSPP